MIYLFDWGNTLMKDDPHEQGPMYLWKELVLCEHAGDMLRALSVSHLCCLATNAGDSDEGDIRKALKRVGIDAYITRIFCYRTLGVKKPAPAFFNAVCTSLSCRPGDITMVGDDLEKDYVWARENGAGAILYDPQGHFRDTGYSTIQDLME